MTTKTKPLCTKCKSNKNVVEFGTYYRCCFCGKTMEKEGQAELNYWII